MYPRPNGDASKIVHYIWLVERRSSSSKQTTGVILNIPVYILSI